MTLLPSCDDCLKSWSLNLLEPKEPVQGCIGIALLYCLQFTLERHTRHFGHLIIGKIANKIQESFQSKEYYQEDRLK